MQKTWRPTGSIASRIWRLVGISAFVAAFGCMFVAGYHVFRSERSALLARTLSTASDHSDAAAEAVSGGDAAFAQLIADRIANSAGAARVTLLNNEDRVFVSRAAPEHAMTASAPTGPVTAYAGRLWHDTFGGYQLNIPLKQGSLRVGQMLVDVPSNPLGASLLVLAVQQLAAALMVVVIALVLTHRGRRFITHPIENLLTAMEALASKGDYSQKIEPHGPDEIGSLIISFNGMVEELRTRDQRLSEHRRQLQELVIQRTRSLQDAAQIAEKSSHAKGDFLARMSHEIRTPMNGLVGMAELLDNTALDNHQHRMLRTMRSSADALLEIINDVLDFSKIEAGRLQILTEDFPIRGLLEEVCDLLASRAVAKGLELVVDVGAGVPSHANGDPLRIRQVLINLIGNAIKYTEQGEVVIGAALDGRDEQQFALRVEVADTGAGIPEDQIERIFEEFTQVDTFESRKHGGTGLGLAITRQLVTLMGGTVGVKSQVGVGSTFWVRLSLANAREAPKPDQWSVIGVRALMVVGNDAARNAIQKLLEASGAWSVGVATAHRGLEKLALEQAFDLVIVDQDLPDLSGLAFLERLRGSSALAAVPTIMLTRTASPAGTSSDSVCEPDAWLAKPVRWPRLQEAIDRCLGRISADNKSKDDSSSALVRSLGLKVLLVEDSPVNTEVAVGMLEAIRCSVTAVDNGELGVENALGETFDVVLMDCQMPLMDGFEATRKIRSGEAHHGRPNVPIIAITANALPGDRERCLAAGMTDFISKPFTLKRLSSVIRAVAGTAAVRSAAEIQTAEQTGDTSRLPVIEFGQIEELRALGRPQLVRKTLLMFLQQSAALLREMDGALQAGDLAVVERATHTLRSSSLNVGGRRLAVAAGACESMARDGNAAGATAAAAKLRPEFSLLSSALAELLDAEQQGCVA